MTENTIDILLDYSAARLDRPRLAKLERHMETCAACTAFATQQAAVWSVLDEWEPAPVTMDFNRRLWRRIDLLAAAPWYRRFADSLKMGTWKPALPLAAAVAVIVAGFLFDHRANAPIAPSMATSVSIIEVDQVEETLDDIQLLKQFDSQVTAAGASTTM